MVTLNCYLGLHSSLVLIFHLFLYYVELSVSLIYKFMSPFYHRLSGLIVDVFGDVAVIASSAAWVEKYKPEVEASIGRIDEINYINWRPSSEVLKEEGLDASNYQERDPSICPQRTKVYPTKCYILHILTSYEVS